MAAAGVSGRTVSVRLRILLSMVLVAAIGMAAAGAASYAIQRERALATIDERLTAAVVDGGTVATAATGASLEGVLTAVIQQIRPETDETTVGIIDGRAALTPGGTVSFQLADPVLIDRIAAETAGGDVVRGTADSDGRTVRYIASPVVVPGQPQTGVFVAAFDLDAALRPLGDAFRTFAAVAAAAVLLLGVVGWLVAGRLLLPIRILRETAARITASDVGERIPVSGNDDVSELTATVNQMLDRLDGALTSQRRLLDDVGHELKTPITIVRGHLELMDARDPADVSATRELAIDELDRMNGLVRDISSLAELDRPIALRCEPTDVAALTQRVRSKAAGLSAHEWVVRESADVTALVDPERLTQALLQLAANAVAHGARTTIELGSALDSAADGGSQLRLWVRDDGPGIPQAAQAHIFERFRRGAESDSAVGRGATGSGLGLAIVAAIARAHGGRVTVGSAPGRGSTFTVALPFRAGDGAGGRAVDREEGHA
jgi:two-component system OmpR family sensor kinase